jgi:Holliday junction resolvase RusA-like endonuclease
VTFTDAKTVAYENLVRFAAVSAYGSAAPMTRPVAVEIVVRLAPPASATKRQRAEMLAGDRAPTRLPDLDNVAKAVLDGCNGVVFDDDRRIVRLSAWKVYANTTGVDVLVQPTGAN